jgi:hypothetical protein
LAARSEGKTKRRSKERLDGSIKKEFI